MSIDQILNLIKTVNDTKFNIFEYESDSETLKFGIDTKTNNSRNFNLVKNDKTKNKSFSSDDGDNKYIVKSPLNGIIHLKNVNSGKLYKNVGDYIDKSDVLCIIEVMKTLVEIKSEYSGKISKFLVDDNEEIVSGQPLMIIKNSQG